LEEIFKKYTAARIVGRYQLLILNGHASYKSAEFNLFCKNYQIIPLYIPSYLSNYLQPFDVGCFAPLKEAYSKGVIESIQKGTYYINKVNFLDLYKEAQKSLLLKNIYSGFEASGLILLNL